jgi:hypothetical protein
VQPGSVGVVVVGGARWSQVEWKDGSIEWTPNDQLTATYLPTWDPGLGWWEWDRTDARVPDEVRDLTGEVPTEVETAMLDEVEPHVPRAEGEQPAETPTGEPQAAQGEPKAPKKGKDTPTRFTIAEHHRGALTARQWKAVAKFAAKDNSRPVLASLAIGPGWVAAADGFRLIVVETQVEVEGYDVTTKPLLLEVSSFKGLTTTGDNRVVVVYDNQVNARIEERTQVGERVNKMHAAWVVDGTFPEWSQIVPVNPTQPTEVIAFDPAFLKDLGELGTAFSTYGVVQFHGSQGGSVNTGYLFSTGGGKADPHAWVVLMPKVIGL